MSNLESDLDHQHSWSHQQDVFAKALGDINTPVPDVIKKTGNQPSSRRFGVYRNGGMNTLTEVLAANFPVVSALIGEGNFAIVARDYLANHLPKTPVLAQFGEQFPEFLAGFPHLQHLGFLKDLAQLERLWLVAYNAAEGPTVEIETLGAVDPELLGKVKFKLHPAMGLVCSEAPIASIWFAHQACDPAQALKSLPEGGEDVLISRPEAEVELRRLPHGAAGFIAALITGASLGEAAETAAEKCEEFDMATAIGGLFEAGAVMNLTGP